MELADSLRILEDTTPPKPSNLKMPKPSSAKRHEEERVGGSGVGSREVLVFWTGRREEG